MDVKLFEVLRLIPSLSKGELDVHELTRSSGLPMTRVKTLLHTISETNGFLENNLSIQSITTLSAVLAIRLGASLDEALRHIGWKDFEGFVGNVLSINGYRVLRNVRLKKPNAEIDLVGIGTGIILAIDCKHWLRTSGYRNNEKMKKVVEAQIHRAKRLSVQTRLDDILESKTIKILPVITTLLEEQFISVGGVPIVPVTKLRTFLQEFEAEIDRLYVIKGYENDGSSKDD